MKSGRREIKLLVFFLEIKGHISEYSLCLFHRHLDDGEPLVGVLLIPDAVDVNGARRIGNLVALFLQIGKELDIVVIEFLIRAEDLQTGGLS